MTGRELKDILEFYINHGQGDNIVAVKLKEPSIGYIANTKVKNIYDGIDWDHGKLIIDCEDELLSYAKDRDKPQSAVKIIYRKYPKVRPVIHCPICENKLRKTDKYCSRCGQAVSMENLREFEI